MKNSRCPPLSKSWKDVEAEMKAAQRGDMPWRDARNFKPAYFAGEDLLAVANGALNMYLAENAIFSRTAYPSLSVNFVRRDASVTADWAPLAKVEMPSATTSPTILWNYAVTQTLKLERDKILEVFNADVGQTSQVRWSI